MTVVELSYEQQRLQNIKDNEALLLSLGLSVPSSARPKLGPRKTVPALKGKSKVAATKPKPREVDAFKPSLDRNDDDDEDEDEREELENPKTKKKRAPRGSIASTMTVEGVPSSPNPSLRRSGRASRRPSYLGLQDEDDEDSPRAAKRRRVNREGDEQDSDSEPEERDGRQRNAQRLGVRTQDPKTFGHIPGVEVGKWWASRMDASTDAVHAPTVAGISGNPQDGAWSVALSGGYADDIDLGYAFTYTGCGGRDLKGTKQNPKNLRTAPQTSHQSFSNVKNAALKRSAETREPVRVIRGFKLDSKYAPAAGYRYDGLYIVEKAWMAKGLTKGLMVCRYAFKRMDGQPSIPERVDEEEEEAEADAVEGEM